MAARFPVKNGLLQSDLDANNFKILNLDTSNLELNEVVLPNEVWISVRTDDVEGNGTIGNPFDGSTQVKFDAIMSDITKTPANCKIHLGDGTFITKIDGFGNAGCAFFVRSGWDIEGVGKFRTTVQLTGNMAGKSYGVAGFKSDSSVSTDYVTISNLTVDCNSAVITPTATAGAGAEKNYKSGGIGIFGSHNTAFGVRVINSYGTLANGNERFDIYFSSPNGSSAVDNHILNCMAHLPAGNYGSPFSLFGNASHPIYDSRVEGCIAFGVNNGGLSPYNTGGVNGTYMVNCDIRNNHFTDCFGLFYCDTGTFDGIVIDNNTVIRGWNGVTFANAEAANPRSNIIITNNRLNIQNRIAGENTGIKFSGENTSTKVVMDGNVITFDTTGNGTTDEFWGIIAANLVDANILNNTIEGGKNNTAVGTGVHLAGNRDFDGSFLPGLLDSLATGKNNVFDAQTPGTLKVTGTFSGTDGVLQYKVTKSDYTIVAGDRLRYDVMIDETSSSVRPWGNIRYSDSSYGSGADQNGLLQADRPDLSTFALGQWYSVDMLLTADATKVAQTFNVGERATDQNLGVAGTFIFYYRNARIVGSNGKLKREFFNSTETFTSDITTNVSGNSATILNPAIPAVFIGSGASHTTGLVPDPGASSGTTKFLREDATFAVPPASAGVTIESTSAVIKGDGAGGGVAATPGTLTGDYVAPSTAFGRLLAATTAITSTANAYTINWNTTTSWTHTLTENVVYAFSNSTDTWDIVVTILNSASNYTVGWPSGIKWQGGTAPTMTIGAKRDVYTFIKQGSVIVGAAVQNLS